MMTLDAVIASTITFFGLEEPKPYDFEVERLQKLNEEKRKASIAMLGEKWLLHPSNKITINQKDQWLLHPNNKIEILTKETK